MENFNELQTIKRKFFAFRNGVVADMLRNSGLGYKIIFGLNLPQLTEIARETRPDAELAVKLWENRSTRESMLLAPMIYPEGEMSRETALKWLREAPTTEVADVVCLKLVRKLPFAIEVAETLSDDSDEMARYSAMRLSFNLISAYPDRVAALARKELGRDCRLTAGVCRAILDEISFLNEEC